MVIGICGAKRSGKDTTANFIRDSYGYDVQSLAKIMKEALKIVFGWTDAHFEWPLKETIDQEWGISPRQALQNFGTDWGQHGLMNAYPDFFRTTGRKLWVRRICQKIIQVDSVWCGTVIPDVRFPHEVDEFKKFFGQHFKLIRVRRETAEAIVDTHESEAHYMHMDPDWDIFNNGTLVELKEAVDYAMETMDV